MRRFLRIDGYDEGGIEEKPNIGAEPSATKIAGTEYAAVRTCIMRARAANRQCHY